MCDFWVEVHTEDMNQAREWMFENYGDKWSMMYTVDRFDKTWYPGGCYERIFLTTKKEHTDDETNAIDHE